MHGLGGFNLNKCLPVLAEQDVANGKGKASPLRPTIDDAAIAASWCPADIERIAEVIWNSISPRCEPLGMIDQQGHGS